MTPSRESDSVYRIKPCLAGSTETENSGNDSRGEHLGQARSNYKKGISSTESSKTDFHGSLLGRRLSQFCNQSGRLSFSQSQSDLSDICTVLYLLNWVLTQLSGSLQVGIFVVHIHTVYCTVYQHCVSWQYFMYSTWINNRNLYSDSFVETLHL